MVNVAKCRSQEERWFGSRRVGDQGKKGWFGNRRVGDQGGRLRIRKTSLNKSL